MYPSRLPTMAEVAAAKEEHSSTYYHPSGMLDRDQRTAFTTKKIQNGPSSLILLEQLIHKTTFQSSSENSNHHHNNSESCKFEFQIKDDSETVMRLSTKYSRSIGFNRMRTKICAYLHVFVWIWLLSLSPTLSLPTTISSSKESSQFECTQNINQSLREAQNQSFHSLSYLNSTIEDFRKAANIKAELWMHIHINNRMDKTKIKDLFSEKNPTKKQINKELEIIIGKLYNVQCVFSYLMKLHQHNNSYIHYFNNTDFNSKIIDFFNNSLTEVNRNINECKFVFKASGISFPTLTDTNPYNYNKTQEGHDIFEFLKVEEYRDLLQDVWDFYNQIINMFC